MAHLAALTKNILLSTSTTLITTTDPVRIAEDYAYAQHLTDGRVDLMLGRGNTGRYIRGSAKIFVRAFPWQWRTITCSEDYGEKRTCSGRVRQYRQQFEHYGHGAAEQAIVGLGGQVFIAETEKQAKEFFRPYFDNAPVYGHGSLEEFESITPLTVGTVDQVVERYASYAEKVGSYQRQLFLVDHAVCLMKLSWNRSKSWVPKWFHGCVQKWSAYGRRTSHLIRRRTPASPLAQKRPSTRSNQHGGWARRN